MPELKRLFMTRIVATPEALDASTFMTNLEPKTLVFRVAPDEAFIYNESKTNQNPSKLSDDHAIITQDASLAGIWLSTSDANQFLEHECAWQVPTARPAFAQGAVAHLPAKLYLEETRVLLMTPAVYASELSKRLEGYVLEGHVNE